MKPYFLYIEDSGTRAIAYSRRRIVRRKRFGLRSVTAATGECTSAGAGFNHSSMSIGMVRRKPGEFTERRCE
jgi:hypothetical protein